MKVQLKDSHTLLLVFDKGTSETYIKLMVDKYIEQYKDKFNIEYKIEK